VAWKTAEDNSWNSTITSTSSAYTIVNLTASTDYDIKVRTVCAAGDSSIWSPVSHFTTNDAPVCTTPAIISSAVTVTDIPSDPITANIIWTVNSATKWIVEYKTAEATEWTYTGDTATTNSITLTDLIPCAEYEVRVKAVCDIDFESEWSTVVTFTTQLTCDAPTIINASSTENSISITWQANSNETEWHVTWETNDGTGEDNVSGTPSYTLTNLLPTTSYHICINAICQCQQAIASDTVCTVSTTVGIADIPFANELQLYPNPATSQLEIKNYELREGNKVEIYNMLGQNQLSIINYQLSIIDVSHLSAGMYVVKIGGYVGKFVKK
jgi:hypothetical protein